MSGHSVRIYRVLLRAYPARFRALRGDEMVQVFGDCCRQAWRRGRLAGLARLWRHALGDLLTSAARERWVDLCAENGMKLKTVLVLAIALMLAALAGWVDVHNTDVQPAVACLLAFSFGLALARPRLWWLWALLVGLSIPVAHLIVCWVGFTLTYPVDGFAGTFIALLPATIGAAAGGGVRWILSLMIHRGTAAGA